MFSSSLLSKKSAVLSGISMSSVQSRHVATAIPTLIASSSFALKSLMQLGWIKMSAPAKIDLRGCMPGMSETTCERPRTRMSW